MTPYVIAGLVVGSIYAISALGLVLTYSSSRIFNFAHGALAYGIAIFYYWLTRRNGWSIATAAPFTILVVAPLLGLGLYFVLFRPLTHATPTVRLVSTVGLWVAIPALVRIIFPWARNEIFSPQGLVNNPADANFLKVFGTWINTNQFAVIVSAVVIVVVLSLVLRLTPLGLTTRATVDHPRNASIAGINTSGVTVGSWMVGVMLAGFAGVLLGPVVGLMEIQFTLLLVGSFAAVVIGRMSSLPLTFFGAIGIGLLQQIWVKYQPDSGILSKGVSDSIPFFVMLGFLIAYSLRGEGLRRESFEIDRRTAAGAHREAPPLPPAHGWRRAIGPLVGAVVLVALPFLFNDTNLFGVTFDRFWIAVMAQGLALSIIFLSYTMVTGEGGMIALSQITFAGIGAFAAARLAAEAGVPMWAAILLGACIAVPFGLLVALPSLRIGDLYLALLTIGFALVVEFMVFSRDEFDNFGSGLTMPQPFGLSVDGRSTLLVTLDDRVWLYLLFALVFGVIAWSIVNLKRATTGLVFASIRSSEPASATTGVSIVRAKLVIFAVSSFVAGLGGALYGTAVGTITPSNFVVLVGVVWLAIVVTWGVRSVVGALLAGMIFAIAPQKLSIILVLMFAIALGALFTLLLISRAHRTVLGVLAMAALPIVAIAGALRMWDRMSNADAVNAILVLLTLAISALLVTRALRARSLPTPVRIAVAVVVTAAAAYLISLFVGGSVDLSDSTFEVPTMLFGLGAIGLAREPRGVLYDIVNRARLRQFEETERREEAALAADERARDAAVAR